MNWNWLKLNFQHCYRCGALTLRNAHFCVPCQGDWGGNFWLRETKSPSNRLPQEWRGFPLHVLGSYRDSQTQMLIRALKGGDSNLEFTLLAEALVQRRLSSPMTLPQGEVTVVPCPSRRTGMKDHAACLALTICALTGWKYSNILQFQGLEKETQKQKKANNRRERRFLLAESIILPVGTLIFVDDLLTTGSTAEAAWVALKRPQQFEVWCIAYQPKLAITKAI